MIFLGQGILNMISEAAAVIFFLFIDNYTLIIQRNNNFEVESQDKHWEHNE